MLKTYKLSDGRLVESDVPSAVVLVYAHPNEQEKTHLIKQELVAAHALSSSLDPDELGRVDFEANHLSAIIKNPKRYQAKDHFLLKVSSIGLFLFADKLIIVHTKEDGFFEESAFQRVGSVQDVFLKVIANTIFHFHEHLRVIQKISDELDEAIQQAVSNKDLFNMFRLEKSLVYYVNAISSNNKVIDKLKLNASKIGFSQEARESLEEIFIENTQCHEQANTYTDVLSNLMDAFASIINNNLNVRIKTFTILSLCIMVPTFIVSLFSMNVALPLSQTGTLMPFWVIAALAFASVVMIFLFWHYRKW
ncbi:MAG TPA: magnesium transporter CorA family protein [Candidatus Omnitrophota bacterium]|nr:magnesium transporter CorA family protein [Candidatus Omnitrophota bacterium]